MKYPFYSLLLMMFFSMMESTHAQSIIGHWTLDGDAHDHSVHATHGKIYGDPEIKDGVIQGQALDFNGDDYIEITADGAAPQHIKNLSSGTISLWFKARSWDVENTILPLFYYGGEKFCEEGFSGHHTGMIIEVGHGGIFPAETVFFTQYNQSCTFPTMCFDSNDGSGIIEPGKWYHFVAVVGEDFNTGYLNGQELIDRRYNFQSDTSTLFFDDYLTHDKMWIGKSIWLGKEVYFDGLIDDVRIYSSSLDADEVKALYGEKK